MSVLLLNNEILSMTAKTAHALVAAGDGDCALLYLALLENGDRAKAAAALHWEDGRLNAAYDRLAAMELVVARQDAPGSPPAEDYPRPAAYTRGEVIQAMENEPEFTGLYREVENLLGRPLSDKGLQELYALYEGMALPADVILMAAHYVRAAVRRKRGANTIPRLSEITREASRWKRLGLDSHEAAEAWLVRQQSVDAREWEILSAVGVTQQRPAVEKEREYIARWVEAGYSTELIRLAYERTVFRRGAMNWPYVDKILQSWRAKGYTTARQVEQLDRPQTPKTPAGQGKTQPDYQADAARIRKSDAWLDEFLKDEGGK